MNQDERPTVAQCGFCEQGQLRPMRCRDCQAIVAICDECELIWADLEAVHKDAKTASSGSHPHCPACSAEQSSWELLTRPELAANDLVRFLA